MAASIAILGAILAIVFPLPYYRFSPGTVYDTVERVEVSNHEVFLPEGDVGFVTVSQTANISLVQWLEAKLSSDVEIRHEHEVIGDRTADEKREEDERRMQLSKNSAVVVALKRLGYEPTATPLGVEVVGVISCTGAEGVLGTGDLILAVDGQSTFDTEDLLLVLSEREVGDEIELLVGRLDPNDVSRSSHDELVSLILGSADDPCLDDEIEADAPRPFIGIGTNDYAREELPFEVTIDTGSVGGPSAGLAFTLAVIDVLSEGELTGGHRVVATGTIDRDGNVGPVGGIQQKVAAARDSGTELFLVPMCCDNWRGPGNYEEAQRHAGSMAVIGVETLDDALAAIAQFDQSKQVENS